MLKRTPTVLAVTPWAPRARDEGESHQSRGAGGPRTRPKPHERDNKCDREKWKPDPTKKASTGYEFARLVRQRIFVEDISAFRRHGPARIGRTKSNCHLREFSRRSMGRHLALGCFRLRKILVCRPPVCRRGMWRPLCPGV